MEQYISKSALVAEINRVLNSYDPNEITSGRYALVDLRDFIDTLEVKEVDINKEISQFIDANFEKATIGHKLSLRRIAKHFFELGMQVNNPITAADRGKADEIIFALNTLGKEKMISYDKEIEWLNKLKKL